MIFPMRWICQTLSESETQRLGRIVARAIEPGMVLGLVGPLGAGKTQFVKAVAEGLGVDRADVTSPTFVLIQEYAGRIPLYHFDAYRVGDLEEFLELGAEELMTGDGVCLIEWANRFEEALPPDALWVEIQQIAASSRQWEFRGTGRGPERAIEHVRAAWESASTGK